MWSVFSVVKVTQGGPGGARPSTGHGIGGSEWESSWEKALPGRLCFQPEVPLEGPTPLIGELLMASLERTEQLSSLLPEM